MAGREELQVDIIILINPILLAHIEGRCRAQVQLVNADIFKLVNSVSISAPVLCIAGGVNRRYYDMSPFAARKSMIQIASKLSGTAHAEM
jgi:hypothetical protein